MGNLTGLVVRRDGECLPAGSSCWQRFQYEWSETDELVRAQRWDLETPVERGDHGWLELSHPDRRADAELRYSYGTGGVRVRKTIVEAAQDLHTLYISSSVEVRRTAFEGEGAEADYRLGASVVELRLPAGMATARVIYSEEDLPTKTSQQKQHLFLSLSDTVGSTSIVIDHATGELVEHATYMAYGTSESSYRTERWGEERDPYRFGGKEEDIEVGLAYFGARYYSPFLGAWLSTDPVTIHELSSDTNPYAYVYGSPLMGVDPDGRFAVTTAIIVGAVVGAILGAGTSIAVQASTGNGWDLKRVNGWKVLGAAAVGAVAGAVSGGVGSAIGGIGAGTAGGAFGSTIGGGAVSGAVAGAAGGAASYVTASALHGSALSGGGRFSWGGLGRAMAMGAVGGAIGGGAGVAAGGEFLGAMTGGVSGAGGGYATGLAFGAEFSTESLLFSIGGGIAGAVAGYGVGRPLGNAIEGSGGTAASSAARSTLRPPQFAGPDNKFAGPGFVYQPRAVLMVGDPGLGKLNQGQNFIRAANTEAATLRAMGWDTTVVRVSSIQDVTAALSSGPQISRVSYFGHSSEFSLHVGEYAGADTNVDFYNVGALRSTNMAPGAEVFLLGCNGGTNSNGIAAAMAIMLNRTIYGWTDFSHFKSDPGFASAPPWVPIKGTGPLYSRPDNGQPLRAFHPPPSSSP